MKENFILTFKGAKSNVSMRIQYTEGLLAQVVFMDPETPFGAREWCLARLPGQVEELHRLGTAALLEAEPTDLTFPAFWEEYGNKVNRDRAYKFWQALSTDDRIAALRAIPKYNRYLQHKPNIEKKYPDTWIKNRSWNDEYRIK